VNSIALTFAFDWDKFMDGYLALQDQAMSLGTAYLDFGCLKGEPRDDFVGETLIYGFFPVMLVSGVLAVAAVQSRHAEDMWGEATSTATNLGVLVLFFLQPYLVKRFALIFSCVKLGRESGDLFLTEDMDVQCWQSGTHWLYIVFLGLPLLVFYVVGVPWAVYSILSRPDSQVKIGQVNEWMSSQLGAGGDVAAADRAGLESRSADELSVESFQGFQRNYGFLFVGYQPKHYYWEIVVMARKASLSLIGVALAFDMRAQVNLGLLTISIAVVAQSRVRPFSSDLMNSFELCSVYVSFFTFFLGIFTTGSEDIDR